MSEETFTFSTGSRKRLFIAVIAGVVLAAIGALLATSGGHGHEAESAAGHHYSWIHRLWVNLWINNVYFAGIALTGVLFLAIQYAAQAGWSAYIKRVPEAFGAWLPIAAVLTFVLYFVTNYASGHFHIFHWLDPNLTDPTSPEYDPIIDGKSSYLNQPFFLIRMAFYFIAWILIYWAIRRESVAEDMDQNDRHWKKIRVLSTIFIIVFAISSSMAAWDWVMSIDAHWFSTLFGWYNFSSWFVAAIAGITLIVIWLREQGYLMQLTSSHLHDLGKYVFAFSIFWAYLWVSQFLLIYYANIPEESVYYIERLRSGQYAWIFYLNIIANFFFPFLVLMTRDSKRHMIFLKIVCPVIIIGHWFDFYLMITPGTLQENGGFGLMEIGVALVFGAFFILVVMNALKRVPLVARNHPMLEESLHHHI
jgi:hypothetical protein